MVVWPLCGFCVLDPIGWFSIQDSNQRLWMDFEEGVASWNWKHIICLGNRPFFREQHFVCAVYG